MAEKPKYDVQSIGDLLARLELGTLREGDLLLGLEAKITKIFSPRNMIMQSVSLTDSSHSVINWIHGSEWDKENKKWVDRWTDTNPEIADSQIGRTLLLRHPAVSLYTKKDETTEWQLKGGTWKIVDAETVQHDSPQPTRVQTQNEALPKEKVNLMGLLNEYRLWNKHTQENWWSSEDMRSAAISEAISQDRAGKVFSQWDKSQIPIGEIDPKKVAALAICQKQLEWTDEEAHKWFKDHGYTVSGVDEKGKKTTRGSKTAVPVGEFTKVLGELQTLVAEKKREAEPPPPEEEYDPQPPEPEEDMPF